MTDLESTIRHHLSRANIKFNDAIFDLKESGTEDHAIVSNTQMKASMKLISLAMDSAKSTLASMFSIARDSAAGITAGIEAATATTEKD
jgi:hypothetical protein